jgi:Protein of unknown function (DUF1826)
MLALKHKVDDIWANIHVPDCPILIEPRNASGLAGGAVSMLRDAQHARSSAGTVDDALAAFSNLPSLLQEDMRALAHRFTCLMGTDKIRIRLETITSNACKKIHADYTDLRLITTYVGPGSEFVPFGLPPEEANLQAIPTGHIGLFKGRLFGAGHAPCFHRSPRIEGSGQTRLVLVIDTPDRERAL